MPDTYHHGDLRRALLDEAHAVLAERGVGALSLRDLARRTDVSPTAPYHHFKGKTDLVCALAEDALDGLDRALAAPDHADPAERIRAMGVAYVRYAVAHPERFRLAFRPEMGDPFAGLAQDDGALPDDIAGFRHLLRAVSELDADAAEQVPLAVALWSLVHGLAALLVDGPLRTLAADPDRVEALAQDVTNQVWFTG
ncbi:MAG: TetR/AcrR family transcriptional regulator [Bacteroidota bacterium]